MIEKTSWVFFFGGVCAYSVIGIVDSLGYDWNSPQMPMWFFVATFLISIIASSYIVNDLNYK